MATVIFDFDSTLITCESLEEILKSKRLSQRDLQQIEKITDQGMSGTLSFLTSFETRMGMASLSKQDFISFGQKAMALLTPKIKDLITHLENQRIKIWIVSGTVIEAIAPVAQLLGIPMDRILGLDLTWSPEGMYTRIDGSKPINRSKWEGAQEISKHWSSPRVAVGDGMTDYALYEHGLVDHFIAFTGNRRRSALLQRGVPEAKNIAELQLLLTQILDANR